MRVVGVICEYNPFHKGHAYHLARAREISGADYVVCVMSGSVTQRGAFARYDKWTRAKAALLNGADLVIELPVRFACASAQAFASGGVSLLSALGVITHLSFGCEKESLPLLSAAADALADESSVFKASLHAQLDCGMPYPRARALAAQEASGIGNLAEIIARPNAALALEYLAALPESIAPVPVEREGAGYHDEALSALSSATAVRAAIARGDMDAALCAVPCPDLLAAAEARGDTHEEEALTQALLYRLRTAGAESLRDIAGMDEGLEYRFLSAANTAKSREELLSLVKTKRYTHARLSRLCTLALLSVTRKFTDEHSRPTCARVLGFRREAAPLLNEIKKRSSMPLVTKAADFDDPLFALDVRAQDLWSLGCASPSLRAAGRDYTTSPVIL